MEQRPLTCPRCRQELGEGLVPGRGGDGGGYRQSMVRVNRCHGCHLIVVDAEELATHQGLSSSRLAGTILDRGRKRLREICPRDGLTSMERLTLSWASTWAEIEQCPDCGIIVLDDGEAETLKALVQGTPSAATQASGDPEQALFDALDGVYKRVAG